MDASIYRLMAQTQRDHWWFRARRAILEAQILRLGLPSSARVLEVGCGTGGNLPMLARFGSVDAMEMDAYAAGVARESGCADVREGWLPDAIPFDACPKYDLVCLFDVLEHCADDRAALASLAPLLARGANVLVTVPAYNWLFGAHDRAHHHHRRYTLGRLRRVSDAAGYEVADGGYFNTLLFPLVAARRTLARAGIGRDEVDASMPSPALNRLLGGVFAFERRIVPRVKFPFGTSVIAVLRQAAGAGRGTAASRKCAVPSTAAGAQGGPASAHDGRESLRYDDDVFGHPGRQS